VKVQSIGELEDALKKARGNERSTVIVIDTDPLISTDAGGHWWDVAVPEVSVRSEVTTARKNYENALASQRVGD
jgi:3D-(3,5/4)-trihydroxycyclohexane-1,2-dione acylhydrolase (decyclizing)